MPVGACDTVAPPPLGQASARQFNGQRRAKARTTIFESLRIIKTNAVIPDAARHGMTRCWSGICSGFGLQFHQIPDPRRSVARCVASGMTRVVRRRPSSTRSSRRKPGPSAPQGAMQRWVPACAGMSGERRTRLSPFPMLDLAALTTFTLPWGCTGAGTMSVLFLAGGAAFAAGAAVGSSITLALAKDKLAAMSAAASQANAIITSQSDDALKDLADAHARAEAMIGAIETAKLSTARAETSVTHLIAKIHHSRASLEKVARLDWFPSLKAAPREPAAEKPRFSLFARKEPAPAE